MSAEAVCAVRRGLRMEFSRPSLPGSPSNPGQRTADHARDRARDRRGQHGDADEDADRAHAHQRDGGLGQPDGQQDHADQGQGRAPDEPAPQRDARAGLTIIERGDRRDAHGVPRRTDRGHDRHADADGQPHQHGTRLEHQRSGGQCDPEPAQQRLEPERGQHAQAKADHGRDEPGEGRLGEHGTEHLTAARADDPQQGQFARPLPDDDRERVEDGEPADEQGDEREDQQRRGEERQRLVDRVRVLVHHGLPGDHLHPARQDPGDGPLDRGLVWRPGRSPR